MKSSLLFFVALSLALLPDCGGFRVPMPVAPSGSMTPEQAVDLASPPQNGAHRFYAVKAAPGGNLGVYFDSPVSAEQSSQVSAGYVFVTLESSGWATHEGGGFGGTGSAGQLFYSITTPDAAANRTIMAGRVLDPNGATVAVDLASGQRIQ